MVNLEVLAGDGLLVKGSVRLCVKDLEDHVK